MDPKGEPFSSGSFGQVSLGMPNGISFVSLRGIASCADVVVVLVASPFVLLFAISMAPYPHLMLGR